MEYGAFEGVFWVKAVVIGGLAMNFVDFEAQVKGDSSYFVNFDLNF